MNIYNNESINYKTKVKYFKILRLKLIFITLFILITSIYICNKFNHNINNNNVPLRDRIYNSMKIKGNRITAYNKAVSLNGGSSANSCVYFLAEVLRMNGEKIDNKICNTTELLSIMKKEGFKIEKDYKKLKPGDICFTTDTLLNKKGTPTHTYIFMRWKEEGKYDYAYICDNQARDYGGKIYHLRNITKVDTINNNTKEPFSFFMYR